MTHHLSEAHTLIDKTPLDCYDCIRNRAIIDAEEDNLKGATFWFARATALGPSIPMAYFQWGQMLLHNGNYNGAIAKFALAHQKSPHFADPLEMWGEALMLENRSDLAFAKFEEANKYAPNWGHLHIKWGEALGYVGQKDEAGAQYRIASTLNLSAADKVELARDARVNP
jgi:tetratricopeptide (TPR) repeat protein